MYYYIVSLFSPFQTFYIIMSYKDNASLWPSLLQDSSNLDRPVLYKNYFDKPLFSEEDIEASILKWQEEDLEEAKSSTRVFIGGGGLDYSYIKSLFNTKKKENEDIKQYLTRVFDHKPFSLFLSNVERYNEKLSKAIAELMKPLVEAYGFGESRYNLALLMGNYGYTPFGIHHDSDVGRTLHIVTKGEKTLTFWDRALMYQLTQSTERSFYKQEEFDQLIPHGISHTLQPGDLFLLPVQHYHVGYVPDFNIDLVITFRRVNAKLLLHEATQMIYFKHADYFISDPPAYNPDEDKNAAQLLLDTIAHETKGNSDLIGDAIMDIRNRLESNIGMKVQPMLKTIPEDDYLQHKSVKVNLPFQILHKIDGEDLNLYVRGRDIKLFYEKVIVDCIDMLNRGETIPFEQIVSLFENADIDRENTTALFNLLYEYGGIEIIH
jgi:hypothetical protein